MQRLRLQTSPAASTAPFTSRKCNFLHHPPPALSAAYSAERPSNLVLAQLSRTEMNQSNPDSRSDNPPSGHYICRRFVLPSKKLLRSSLQRDKIPIFGILPALKSYPGNLWRRRSDSNRRITVLQTVALGHLATPPSQSVPGGNPVPSRCQ